MQPMRVPSNPAARADPVAFITLLVSSHGRWMLGGGVPELARRKPNLRRCMGKPASAAPYHPDFT